MWLRPGSNGLIRYPVAYLREGISQHAVDPRNVAGREPRRDPADIRRLIPASQQKAAVAAGNTTTARMGAPVAQPQAAEMNKHPEREPRLERACQGAQAAN